MEDKKRILIIEDELYFARLVKMNLESTGRFDVYIESDGESGLDKVKNEKPDLVILDLLLPGLPGEQVCKEIRSDSDISSTPIVMLTAKTRDAERVVGMVIGADAYLTKPAEFTTILKEIDKVISSKQ